MNARMAMASQLSGYTKSHWVACFRRVNFMVCQLYCNKKKYMRRMDGGELYSKPAMRGCLCEGLRHLLPSPDQG